MKLRFIPALLAFFSAYFPLTLILLIKDFDPATQRLSHPWPLGALFGLGLLSCIVLIAAIRRYEKGGVFVTVSKATYRSADMFSYSMPYVLGFLGFKLDDWRTVMSAGIFMAMLFIVSYRTHHMFVNPVLALFGYGLYDATFKNSAGAERQGFLISRHPLNIGSQCRVEAISHALYVVSDATDPGSAT